MIRLAYASRFSLALALIPLPGILIQLTEFPMRKQHGRRRQASQPIVCKFTRRIARDHVLSKRREANNLEPEGFGLPSGNEMKIQIYSHLTLRLQELLHLAKMFQAQEGYKFCWAKGTAIFLRKTESSKPIRLNTNEDLEQLQIHDGYSAIGRAGRVDSMGRGRGRGSPQTNVGRLWLKIVKSTKR